MAFRGRGRGEFKNGVVVYGRCNSRCWYETLNNRDLVWGFSLRFPTWQGQFKYFISINLLSSQVWKSMFSYNRYSRFTYLHFNKRRPFSSSSLNIFKFWLHCFINKHCQNRLSISAFDHSRPEVFKYL